MRSFTVTKVFGLIVLLLLQTIPLDLLPLPAACAQDDQSSHQTVDVSRLQFEATVTKPETDSPPKTTLATAAPLPEERIKTLLNRLPPLHQPAKSESFVLPEQSLVKPLIHDKEIEQSFPPSSAALRKPATQGSNASVLKVQRVTPEGHADSVPELSITFSQPMVAIGDAGSINNQSKLPVKVTPQPPGSWHWAGTQTLIFKPLAKRFPKSTEYKIEVPAGTTASDGSKLDKARFFNFTTSKPLVTNFYPSNGTQGATPIMIATFNQDVDPEAVLKITRASTHGNTYPLTLVMPEVVKNNPDLKNFVDGVDAKQWVAFKPASQLPLASTIKIDFGPGCKSLEGPLLSTARQSYAFHTYGYFEVTSAALDDVSPEFSTTLPILFSNPIDVSKFKPSMVHFTPAIKEMTATAWASQINIQAKTNPNSKYVISFDPQLTDIFGQKLSHATSCEIKTGNYSPRLDGPDSALVTLPAGLPPVFNFNASGVPQVKVSIYSVTPGDWIKFANYCSNNRQLAPQEQKSVDFMQFKKLATRLFPVGQNDLTLSLDLKPYLNEGIGHVVLCAESVGTEPQDKQSFATWVQVTNIGIDNYIGHDLLVVASSLTDGKLLPQANVVLYPQNSVSQTDRSGLAHLLLDRNVQHSQLVVVTHGADSAFLPATKWHGEGWIALNQDGVERPVLEWMAFTDRFLYRPGETVELKGWVREWHLDAQQKVELTRFNAENISYDIKASDNTNITRGEATVDANGGFSAEFKIPDHVNLGDATIELKTVGGSAMSGVRYENRNNTVGLKIQEFRRPEFDFKLKSSAGNTLILGDSTNITAAAAYYAGGPLKDAGVHWNVFVNDTTFSPPGWSEYSFGNLAGDLSFASSLSGVQPPSPLPAPSALPPPPASTGATEVSSDAMDPALPPSPPSENARKIESTTDSLGKSAVRLHFSSLAAPQPLSCSCEATVHDVNRQAYSDHVDLLVHPADLYVGMKQSSLFYEIGTPVELQLIVTDIDGKTVAGKNIHLRMEGVANDGTGKKIVKEQVLESRGEPITASFPPPSNGEYAIVATISDDKGRPNRTAISLSVQGDTAPTSKTVEAQDVKLIADHKSYKEGEVAQILIAAPFTPAHGTVNLIREGIISTLPIDMETTTTVFKVPIQTDYFPNITVQVNLAGNDCAYATGSTELSVPPITKTLDLRVHAEEKELQPGGDTNIAISLKNADGTPVNHGQVALVVADEALLAMADYKWPDPIKAFYPDLQNQVLLFHLRDFVLLADLKKKRNSQANTDVSSLPPPSALPPPPLPTAAPAAMAAKFGDMIPAAPPPPPPGAPSIAVRSNFSALALFTPSAETDENGKAQVHLHLPDSLTRYRIMAIAVSGQDRFGSAESSITARLPLMVKPSGPRFLNFGDSCEFPVVLQNQTAHDMNVDIVARAANATIADAGQTIAVPANDRVEVRFPVQTKSIGTATFQFGASSNESADAAEVSLPILKPASIEDFAAYGEVDNGAAVQKIMPPTDIVDDIGGLKITTSSTALQSLTDAYISLKDYTYECSEQLSARLLAMLAMGDVLTAFGLLPATDEEKFKEIVKADLRMLLSRQRADGGLGLWKADESGEWPFMSTQVIRALYRAKNKGYAVPQQALTRAQNYLRAIDKHIDKHEYSFACRRTVLAYALYVRYQLGDIDSAAAARLVDEAGDLAHQDKHTTASNKSETLQADDVEKTLPIECAAWLLPVLTKGQQTESKADLMRQIILNHITQTASTASVQSEGYRGLDYLIYHSPNRTDAVVLESLIQVEPENSLIPKLAKGLLAHRTNGKWESTQENSSALLALNMYFNKYEKVEPNFDAQAWLGQTFLGTSNFAGRSGIAKTVSLPIAFVEKQGTQDLLLNKEGAGRLYYRIGLEYSPKKLELPACDYGFTVTRTYEGVDNKSDAQRTSDGTWHFKAGANIRVKVSLSCNGTRHHVALMDPLPAGTEPLNPELVGTLLPQTEQNQTSSEAAPYMWWRWTWFDHQNLRDHQAEAFTTLLFGGKYDYSYVVRATIPGNYIVPSAKAEEMYTPETFGRTNTEHVVVN